MTINDELRAMRKRVRRATEGPWHLEEPEFPFRSEIHPPKGARVSGPITVSATPVGDAEFIAHARTDLPRLLDAVERVLGLQAYTAGPDAEPGGDADMWTQGFSGGLETARRAITEALDS